MPMYRKKPVVIEARQMPGIISCSPPIPQAVQAMAELASWCGGAVTRDAVSACIAIDTLEGTMLARPGDWIIKGVKGEFSISRQAAFLADYEGMSA